MCIEVTASTPYVGPYDLAFLEQCDPWAMPHLVNPFLIYLLTRSYAWTYFLSIIFEVFEIASQLLLGNFGFFIKEVDFGFENLAHAVLYDFFIQATLGIILGRVFELLYDPPERFLRPYHRCQDAIYWVFLIFTLAPQAIYDLYLVEANFPIGGMIATSISALMVLFIIAFEPRELWKGMPERRRIAFWALTYFIYTFFLGFGHLKGDLVISTAITSWVLWGIFILIFVLLLAYDRTLGKELNNWVYKLCNY